MSDERLFILKEIPLIQECLNLIQALVSKPSLNSIEVIALGTLLQNVYMGIESILRCQVTERKLPFSKTENWHKQLLTTALANHLLTDEEFPRLDELRKFRHLHMHGYSHQLDNAQLIELASKAHALSCAYLTRLQSTYRDSGENL